MASQDQDILMESLQLLTDFELTKPDACVFGMKDFQQQLIIKQLIKQKISNKILLSPTERDENGLALVSK